MRLTPSFPWLMETSLGSASGRIHGRLVVLRNGRYDNMPIDTVTASKKVVNVKETLQRRPPASSLQELRDETPVHHDEPRLGNLMSFANSYTVAVSH